MQQNGVSICITLRNRADLLRYCLESITRQDVIGEIPVEVCIADGGSTDSLLNIIDRYSEELIFKFAISDRHKAMVPISSNMPAADINAMIRWMPSYDMVIKMDPEVVMKDPWIIREMGESLWTDPQRMYNCRTHFTTGNDWYNSFDDIIYIHERHYHYAEGGPFSRSRYYFCSCFSREKFIELRGMEELMCYGTGYDDDVLRHMWKNRYGKFEKEITGQAIHLDHGPNQSPPTWEELNRRIFVHLRNNYKANTHRLMNGSLVKIEDIEWGTPQMLSKIYTIKDGLIINTENPGGLEEAIELDLPF